jgi:hypothetical protein
MTKYTVTWVKSAQNELATIWTQATDKQAVADAADAIDRELSTDAPTKGQPATGGLRSFEIDPLQVLFSVSEPDRLVTVLRVARYTPTAVISNGQVPP